MHFYLIFLDFSNSYVQIMKIIIVIYKTKYKIKFVIRIYLLWTLHLFYKNTSFASCSVIHRQFESLLLIYLQIRTKYGLRAEVNTLNTCLLRCNWFSHSIRPCHRKQSEYTLGKPESAVSANRREMEEYTNTKGGGSSHALAKQPPRQAVGGSTATANGCRKKLLLHFL